MSKTLNFIFGDEEKEIEEGYTDVDEEFRQIDSLIERDIEIEKSFSESGMMEIQKLQAAKENLIDDMKLLVNSVKSKLTSFFSKIHQIYTKNVESLIYNEKIVMDKWTNRFHNNSDKIDDDKFDNIEISSVIPYSELVVLMKFNENMYTIISEFEQITNARLSEKTNQLPTELITALDKLEKLGLEINSDGKLNKSIYKSKFFKNGTIKELGYSFSNLDGIMNTLRDHFRKNKKLCDVKKHLSKWDMYVKTLIDKSNNDIENVDIQNMNILRFKRIKKFMKIIDCMFVIEHDVLKSAVRIMSHITDKNIIANEDHAISITLEEGLTEEQTTIMNQSVCDMDSFKVWRETTANSLKAIDNIRLKISNLDNSKYDRYCNKSIFNILNAEKFKSTIHNIREIYETIHYGVVISGINNISEMSDDENESITDILISPTMKKLNGLLSNIGYSIKIKEVLSVSYENFLSTSELPTVIANNKKLFNTKFNYEINLIDKIKNPIPKTTLELGYDKNTISEIHQRFSSTFPIILNEQEWVIIIEKLSTSLGIHDQTTVSSMDEMKKSWLVMQRAIYYSFIIKLFRIIVADLLLAYRSIDSCIEDSISGTESLHPDLIEIQETDSELVMLYKAMIPIINSYPIALRDTIDKVAGSKSNVKLYDLNEILSFSTYQISLADVNIEYNHFKTPENDRLDLFDKENQRISNIKDKLMELSGFNETNYDLSVDYNRIKEVASLVSSKLIELPNEYEAIVKYTDLLIQLNPENKEYVQDSIIKLNDIFKLRCEVFKKIIVNFVSELKHVDNFLKE